MPGLFGILSKRPDANEAGSLLRAGHRMADAMRLKPWLRVEIWGNEDYCGGRVHLGIHSPGVQPSAGGNGAFLGWLDGEYFPPLEPGSPTGPTADGIRRLLNDPDLLSATDGAFSVVGYDVQRRELHLANDRLGFRPLYYMETEKWFAFAGEVKALLALCERTPDLDEVSLRQFFAFDHMLAERTWWKGIELVPPASVWRVSRHGVSRNQYWSFGRLRQAPMEIGDAEARFGELWSADVARHSRPGRMPLLLSGGQDSRALLAELLLQGADLLAVTFGSEDSAEMRPAHRLAALARVPHVPVYLDTSNWWHHREEGIWQTDGMVNGNHLHVASTIDVMRTDTCYSPMNIAGDLLFGGSHLRNPISENWQQHPAQLLQRWYMRNPLFEFDEVVSASSADIGRYADGPSSDCFHIRQRLRRYALYGAPVSLSSYCEIGFAGLSGSLLTLMLGGLREEQRMKHRFYNPFLVKRYPRFFANFPWQATGRGLAESFPTRLSRGLRRRYYRLARVKPKAIRSEEWFVSYPNCVRASRVREKLLSHDLLTDVPLRGRVRRALAGADAELSSGALIAVLTFETYLRQVTGAPAIIV